MRPPDFFYHASAWKILVVKSLFGKSQPGGSAQRGLTYTLSLRGIWAQCIVFQECVFLLRHGAWLAMHPLGINNQVSSSLSHSRSLFECSGEEFLRVITRMSFLLSG